MSKTGTTLGSICLVIIIALIILIALYFKRSNLSRAIYENDLLSRLIQRYEAKTIAQPDESTAEHLDQVTQGEEYHSLNMPQSPTPGVRSKFTGNEQHSNEEEVSKSKFFKAQEQ